MTDYSFVTNKVTAVVGKVCSGKTTLVNDIKKHVPTVNVNDEINCEQSKWDRNWITTYQSMPSPSVRANVDYYIFTSPVDTKYAKSVHENVAVLTQNLGSAGKYVIYNVKNGTFTEKVLAL